MKFSRSAWRMQLVGALVLAPALVVATSLGFVELYRLLRPSALMFQGPRTGSLADAIIGNVGVEYVNEFIRAGQDPNGLITVDRPEFAGDRTLLVSPLMLAAAMGNSNTVKMLVGAGASLNMPQNRFAGCIALQMGHDDLSTVLFVEGSGVDALSCLEPPPLADTLLLRWWAARAAAETE